MLCYWACKFECLKWHRCPVILSLFICLCFINTFVHNINKVRYIALKLNVDKVTKQKSDFHIISYSCTIQLNCFWCFTGYWCHQIQICYGICFELHLYIVSVPVLLFTTSCLPDEETQNFRNFVHCNVGNCRAAQIPFSNGINACILS